jgi:hypothetical protein
MDSDSFFAHFVLKVMAENWFNNLIELNGLSTNVTLLRIKFKKFFYFEETLIFFNISTLCELL